VGGRGIGVMRTWLGKLKAVLEAQEGVLALAPTDRRRLRLDIEGRWVAFCAARLTHDGWWGGRLTTVVLQKKGWNS